MSQVVTVPELLDGHTVLDIECLDRVYLSGYVPTLQVGGQVFTFLHDHRGMPVASPAVFEKIGTRFRQAVDRFAEMNDIPVIKFKKGIRKLDVMQRYLRRAALAGRPGVAAIGRAEEFQLVWDARKRGTGVTSKEFLPGVRLVRAFNSIPAHALASEANRSGERIGVPLAGDDPAALEIASRLVRDAGFEPVVVGPLASASKFDRDTSVYGRALTARELRQGLGLDPAAKP